MNIIHNVYTAQGFSASFLFSRIFFLQGGLLLGLYFKPNVPTDFARIIPAFILAIRNESMGFEPIRYISTTQLNLVERLFQLTNAFSVSTNTILRFSHHQPVYIWLSNSFEE